MKHLTGHELRQIALDIEIELKQLAQLEQEIEKLSQLIDSKPDLSPIFYENQALKLHNFYTGCERIFRIVASELNGVLPTGYDWHKRLLERMAVEDGGRPAWLSTRTVRLLEKFLAFRHVVRNIYGFELETERIIYLLEEYAAAWSCFDADARRFIAWLRETADQL